MLQIQKPSDPFVYICGAGPGDPALLTIKTYTLLTQVADVVVYDRLISDELLAIIPAHVHKIYAGKSCKKHDMTQDEINALLVEEAHKGKVVVRLKGGDPFIFGRGGEEMLHLMQHNIGFEIVPGVNAADGCGAYQNIPLTHRGVADSVMFMTGHQQKGEVAELDYANIVNPKRTLVIYMGMTRLKEIADNLIKHGLPKTTPAVAISSGTTLQEKTCYSDLEHLYDTMLSAQLPSPTLIIIGEVVGIGR